MIETRNDSGQMLQQQLWGRQYIDELIMVSLNMDPQNASSGTATENLAERHFWAVTDANFNVMGLVSEWGKLHERYEYDPYGNRTVYSHGYLLADLDGSGVIDSVDYNMMDFDNADPNTPAWSRADLDGDGDVDDDDVDILDAALVAWLSNKEQYAAHEAGHFYPLFDYCVS